MKNKYNFKDTASSRRGKGIFVTINKVHMYLSLALRTHAQISDGTRMQVLVDAENRAILIRCGVGDIKAYRGGSLCTFSARTTGMSIGRYDLVRHDNKDRSYIFEKRVV